MNRLNGMVQHAQESARTFYAKTKRNPVETTGLVLGVIGALGAMYSMMGDADSLMEHKWKLGLCSCGLLVGGATLLEQGQRMRRNREWLKRVERMVQSRAEGTS